MREGNRLCEPLTLTPSIIIAGLHKSIEFRSITRSQGPWPNISCPAGSLRGFEFWLLITDYEGSIETISRSSYCPVRRSNAGSHTDWFCLNFVRLVCACVSVCGVCV